MTMNLGDVPSDSDLLVEAVRNALNLHYNEDPDEDRIVRLNVGGTPMSVSRDTLCMADGSLLEVMFSGNWDGELTHDASGACFIDQPVELFRPLIDFLRSKSYEDSALGPTQPPLPEEFKSKRLYIQFLRMVDYYGLTRVLYPVRCVNLEEGCGFSVDESDGLTCSSPLKRVRTYILPCFHERKIQSFDVRILGQGDDKFRFGWTESADGVVVFDAARGMVYDIPAHADRHTTAPVETEATIAKLNPGTVISCQNMNWHYRWLVNGETVGVCQAKEDYIYPCVAGQGTWVIENIKYSF